MKEKKHFRKVTRSTVAVERKNHWQQEQEKATPEEYPDVRNCNKAEEL